MGKNRAPWQVEIRCSAKEWNAVLADCEPSSRHAHSIRSTTPRAAALPSRCSESTRRHTELCELCPCNWPTGEQMLTPRKEPLMSIDRLKDRLPDHARDLRLNLGAITSS